MKKILILLVVLIVISTYIFAYTITVSYQDCKNVQVQVGEQCEEICDMWEGVKVCSNVCTPIYETKKVCTTKKVVKSFPDIPSSGEILQLISEISSTSNMGITLNDVETKDEEIVHNKTLADERQTDMKITIQKNSMLTAEEQFRQIDIRHNDNAVSSGDPVRVSIGDFRSTETDTSLPYVNNTIKLTRTFLSSNKSSHSFGTGWIFNYDTKVIKGVNPDADDLVFEMKNTISNINGLISSSIEKYNSSLTAINGVIAQSNSIVVQIESTISTLQNALSGNLHPKIRPEVEADLANAQNKLTTAQAFFERAQTAKQDILNSYINIENMQADLASLNIQLAVMEDEAKLADANSNANRFVVNSTDPSFYQNTGNEFLILMDENGSPQRYKLVEVPDYNSTFLYADGSPNFYPNGSMTESIQPSDNTLELLPNGSFLLTKKDKTKHYYSLYGQLTKIEDANGNGLEFSYDNSHRLVKITDGFGRKIIIKRTGDKIASVVDPDGNIVSYAYDSAGMLSAVTDTEGDTVRYTYYTTGELEKIIKPDNSFRQYNYITQNGKQVVESTVDEEGDTEYFSYHFDEGYTEYTNPAGVRELHYYDDKNRETKVIYADGSWIGNTYDDDNNLTSTRSRTGYITNFEYDENRNITRINYPDGTSESRSYNTFSKPVEITDPDGNRIVNTYDTKGNVSLTKVYGENGNLESVESISYTPKGQVKSRTSENIADSSSTTENYYYDENGNIDSVTDGNGNDWDYTFGVTGLLEKITDPLGNATQYEYTPAGRIKKIIYPDKTTEETAYTNRKDIDYKIDRDGNRYEYTYNKRHNLLSIENPLEETVEYTYNPMGEVLTKSIYDKNNLEAYWEYQYNPYTGKLILQKQQLDDTSFIETGYEYDKGLLWKITDPTGTITEITYNSRDRASSRTVYGDITEFSVTEYMDYTGRGLLEKYTDPLGNETEYEYTALGKVASILNPDYSRKEYTYDGHGRIIGSTDEEGYTTKYKYDKNGRKTEIIHSDNTNEKWEYNDAGYVISYTDRNGIKTTYDVDAFGRVLTKKLPSPYNGVTEKYTYNTRNQILTWTDPNNNTWKRNYDKMGRLIETTDPEGNVTTNEYNPLGQIVKTTTPENTVWKRSYNMAGRVVSQTDPLGAVSSYIYNKAGRIISRKDPLGRTNIFTWDSMGRLSSTRNSENSGVDYTYDAAGNRTSETQTGGTAYKYYYDSRNRLSREVNRLGAEKKYEYYKNGQISKITDFNGNETTFTYNEAARLAEKKFDNGDKESYTYDGMGNILTAVNPSSNLEYAYDPLGRLTKSIDHVLDQTINYEYDSAGNRTQMSWLEDERSMNYTYGKMNELLSVTDSEGEITTFEYDKLGHEITRNLPNGVVTQTSYDPVGHITSIKNEASQRWGWRWENDKTLKSFAYLYNAAGERTYQIDEKGRITAYSYDPTGRIKTVLYPFNSGKKLEDFNRMLDVGLYPGQLDKGKTRFDIPEIPGMSRGHLEEDLKHLLKDHENIYKAINSLDKKTKLTWDVTPKEGAFDFARQMNLPFETEMALKDAYSVISHNQNHDLDTDQWMWSESYSYDERNNITSKTNGWGVTDYTYNAGNQLVKAGNMTFEHDANGNMTKEILGNVTTDYSYTPLNRVTGITSSYPGFLSPDPKKRTTMVQYEYDAFGRRNSRTFYTGHEKHGEVEIKIETQTNHLYEGLGFTVLAEFENKKDNDRYRYRYDPKNNPTIEYLYAEGDILSRNMFKDRKYRGNYRNMKVKDTAYYHQDPLGSTVMITDKKGHVEGNFSYDAFGTLYDDSRFSWGNDNLNERGKHSVPLNLYNGKRLDPAVGLYDYGFRDYSPQQMRFTTVDPIKSGSNWYAYVNNDPVNFIDPLGLTASDTQAARDLTEWEKLAGAEVIGVGATIAVGAGAAIAEGTVAGVIAGTGWGALAVGIVAVGVDIAEGDGPDKIISFIKEWWER